MFPVTVLISALAAIMVSPLLAGWTTGLTNLRAFSSREWWRPRAVNARRLITVAAVAGVLAASAAGGDPYSAWWLFAAGGAVLCVVDIQHHLLPARFVYPLAGILATALAITAVTTGEPDRLLGAALATAVVGAGWFAIAFLAPAALGLGDVRVAAIAAGLLGWTSWSAVIAGQLLAFGFAVVTAVILAIRTRNPDRGMQVPIGPALIVGALVATWL